MFRTLSEGGTDDDLATVGIEREVATPFVRWCSKVGVALRGSGRRPQHNSTR